MAHDLAAGIAAAAIVAFATTALGKTGGWLLLVVVLGLLILAAGNPSRFNSNGVR